MRADLVRIAGVRESCNQAGVFHTPKDSNSCQGRFTLVLINNSAVASVSIDPQWKGDLPFVLSRGTCANGVVNLTYLTGRELTVESPMCLGSAGDYHYPAGILVEAVDNPATPPLGFKL